MADWILKIAHRTAPFLLEGIDMVLAVQLSIKYAGAAGSGDQHGNLHVLYKSTRIRTVHTQLR